MPNGRSGGFVVTREELKRVLEECDGDTVIGKSLQAPVTASAVIGFLAKTRHTHIVVEEQDLEWYILRLRDWVIVDTSSVLYIPFRQFHAQWRRRLVGRHQVSRMYATFDAPESRSDPRGGELAGTIRSLFLLYGRQAWHLSNLLQEPVFLVSGFYFPVRALGFVAALGASVVPISLGLDAMRQLLFPAMMAQFRFLDVRIELGALAVLSIGFLWLARWADLHGEYV